MLSTYGRREVARFSVCWLTSNHSASVAQKAEKRKRFFILETLPELKSKEKRTNASPFSYPGTSTVENYGSASTFMKKRNLPSC